MARMTRAEIGAVYQEGVEAVVALVEALLGRIETLEATAVNLVAVGAAAEATNASLAERVKDLEDRLAVDSHNSNQPPSGDRDRPKPRSQSRLVRVRDRGGV